MLKILFSFGDNTYFIYLCKEKATYKSISGFSMI